MTARAAPFRSSNATRLGMIEAGRAFAAMAVVLFHADTLVLRNLPEAVSLPGATLGERGVDFFFVLSGFIITFVHAGDIGQRTQVSRFVKKRIARIYPLLWVVVTATITLNIAVDSEFYPLAKLWTSYTLWPSLEWPSPAVAWTLRHEVLFYALFGLAIFSRRFGSIIISAWFALCMLQIILLLMGRSLPGIASMVFSPLNLQFAAGCGIGIVFLRYGDRHWRSSLVSGSILLLAAAAIMLSADVPNRTVLEYTDSSGIGADLAFAFIFGAIVHGLAGASMHVRAPRLLLLLGAASYAIYLAHSSVLGLTSRFLPSVFPEDGMIAGLAHFILFTVAVSAGVVLHLLFEKPVGGWLTSILFDRKTEIQATPIAPSEVNKRKA